MNQYEKTMFIKSISKAAFSFLFIVLFCGPLIAQEADKVSAIEAGGLEKAKEKLVVIWTSGDKEVAMKMVLMYTYNAKKYGWWEDITFIIWGPSARLAAEDEEVQEYMKKMDGEGIILKACKACTDQYDVSANLEEIGVEVKYIGQELTEYLKSKDKVITF